LKLINSFLAMMTSSVTFLKIPLWLKPNLSSNLLLLVAVHEGLGH